MLAYKHVYISTDVTVFFLFFFSFLVIEVYTRHMHSLSYRQIHTSVCYYKYSFFPACIVLWNKLPADLVLVPDLDSFKTGVSETNHTHP